MNARKEIVTLGVMALLAGYIHAVEVKNQSVTDPDLSIQEKLRDTDITNARGGVRDADVSYQEAVRKYGKDNPQTKNAARKLVDSQKDLDRKLYQHGRVAPGSVALPNPSKPGGSQRKNSEETAPGSIIKF